MESGAPGRPYARTDKAGCSDCITIDGQMLEDETMAVRYRDSMEQRRMKTAEIIEFLKKKVDG